VGEGLRALLAMQLCCPFVDFASAPCALEAMASERVRISMMRERRARSEACSLKAIKQPGGEGGIRIVGSTEALFRPFVTVTYLGNLYVGVNIVS
jgi:hypothetical protein